MKNNKYYKNIPKETSNLTKYGSRLLNRLIFIHGVRNSERVNVVSFLNKRVRCVQVYQLVYYLCMPPVRYGAVTSDKDGNAVMDEYTVMLDCVRVLTRQYSSAVFPDCRAVVVRCVIFHKFSAGTAEKQKRYNCACEQK